MNATADEKTLTPLLVDSRTVGRLLGVGERFVWAMHASGELGPLPVRLGRRKLWSLSELRAWVGRRCPPREVWLTVQEKQEKDDATVQTKLSR